MRWLLLCLVFSSQAFAAKVLLIESYHSEYPWDQSYIQGLTAALTNTIELDTFQMDTKRIPKIKLCGKSDSGLRQV